MSCSSIHLFLHPSIHTISSKGHVSYKPAYIKIDAVGGYIRKCINEELKTQPITAYKINET